MFPDNGDVLTDKILLLALDYDDVLPEKVTVFVHDCCH
jgi:hypothetical protein